MDARKDLRADRGPFVRREAIVVTVLPTLLILLRFWSRSIANQTAFCWDDSLALCAWVSQIDTFRIVHLGVGKHIEAIDSPSNVYAFLKIFHVSQIVFDSGIAITKYSALLFCTCVFNSQQRGFKITYRFTFLLVIIFVLFKLLVRYSLAFRPRIIGSLMSRDAARVI